MYNAGILSKIYCTCTRNSACEMECEMEYLRMLVGLLHVNHNNVDKLYNCHNHILIK